MSAESSKKAVAWQKAVDAKKQQTQLKAAQSQLS
jgi:hypothetical protein